MTDSERAITILTLAVARASLAIINGMVTGLDSTLKQLADTLEVAGEPPRNPKEPTH